MKVLHWDGLIDRLNSVDGGYSRTEQFAEISQQIHEAIWGTVWPPGAESFTIYPQSGKARGEGNGVKPIKDGFVSTLANFGWELEKRAPAREGREVGAKGSRPGAFDCHRELGGGLAPFAVEWDTGNVSSSHRAINRIALGILWGYISGGILVVPSGAMARYLTDRIGNAPELEPYFDLWREWQLAPTAYLAVVTVEHDDESTSVPRPERYRRTRLGLGGNC